MKIGMIIAVLLLLIPQAADARCWKNKQTEMKKIKEMVVKALEKTSPNEWKFGSGKDLSYAKVTKNKREVVVTISDWGVLTMDHHTIDLPDWLQRRVKKLYRKVACHKVFREVLLMKEFLETP